MISYTTNPNHILKLGDKSIASFLSQEASNIDWETVDSFGEEWGKFASFSSDEISQIGNDYFDVVPIEVIKNAKVLDMGCGSGRWSKYLADRVASIDAVDPSKSVFSALQLLKENTNVRVTQASIDNLPFDDGSFDFVISLGVLHLIPDTAKALSNCVTKVKKGGACLIYLYYDLDNRGGLYKLIFNSSNFIRKVICKFPSGMKKLSCDLIAFTVYLPLARVSGLIKKMGSKQFFKKIPLSYYHDKSFNIFKK